MIKCLVCLLLLQSCLLNGVSSYPKVVFRDMDEDYNLNPILPGSQFNTDPVRVEPKLSLENQLELTEEEEERVHRKRQSKVESKKIEPKEDDIDPARDEPSASPEKAAATEITSTEASATTVSTGCCTFLLWIKLVLLGSCILATCQYVCLCIPLPVIGENKRTKN